MWFHFWGIVDDAFWNAFAIPDEGFEAHVAGAAGGSVEGGGVGTVFVITVPKAGVVWGEEVEG